MRHVFAIDLKVKALSKANPGPIPKENAITLIGAIIAQNELNPSKIKTAEDNFPNSCHAIADSRLLPRSLKGTTVQSSTYIGVS